MDYKDNLDEDLSGFDETERQLNNLKLECQQLKNDNEVLSMKVNSQMDEEDNKYNLTNGFDKVNQNNFDSNSGLNMNEILIMVKNLSEENNALKAKSYENSSALEQQKQKMLELENEKLMERFKTTSTTHLDSDENDNTYKRTIDLLKNENERLKEDLRNANDKVKKYKDKVERLTEKNETLSDKLEKAKKKSKEKDSTGNKEDASVINQVLKLAEEKNRFKVHKPINDSDLNRYTKNIEEDISGNIQSIS